VGVKNSAIIAGFVILTAAGEAWADSSSAPGISGDGSTTVRVRKTHTNPAVLTFGEGSGTVTTPSGGADYHAFVTIDPTKVTFESADSVSGSMVNGTSTTSVDITFVNDGKKSVVPVFKSTIVPAGLGFYLADTTGGCGGDIYAGCPPSTGPYTFADLNKGGLPDPETLASVGFDFSVLSDGVSIYDLAGSMRLDDDGFVHIKNLADASSALDGFALASPKGSKSNVGYIWDDTPLTLSTLTPLAPGASRTITYRVTVNSSTQALCVTETVCLVSYSGFGDPVGTGGGITSALSGLLGSLASSPTSGDGVTFSPAVFDIPTFSHGSLTFHLASSVPEPRSWITMLLGTALMGAMLRRSRRSRLMA
jgi:hypothetical protein